MSRRFTPALVLSPRGCKSPIKTCDGVPSRRPVTPPNPSHEIRDVLSVELSRLQQCREYMGVAASN